MKKLLLLVIVTGIVTASAVAQEQKEAATPSQDQKTNVAPDQKGPKQERADWEKKLKDQLTLTDEQTEKYNALNKEFNEKIDAILRDATLTKDVQKEKKMALKKEKETKLMEILTPEQQVKYREIMDKKKAEKPAGS